MMFLVGATTMLAATSAFAGEPAAAPLPQAPAAQAPPPQAPPPQAPVAQAPPGQAPVAQAPPGQGPWQQPLPQGEPPDGVRFRGAIGIEGGALILPDVVSLGYAGATSQVGVQINNLVGLYVVPQLHIVFGELGGVQIGGALVVDFTIDDIVSVGAGPELSAFAAIGGDSSGVGAAAGAFYGARLHAAVYPVLGKSNNGINRQALAIGADIRFLAGGGASANAGPTEADASVTQFAIAPQLTIAYQAF